MNDRTTWFSEARFGLFVHWGLYAVHGRGEWAMSRERISLGDYTPLLSRFTAERFDPKAWAQLALDAGMKYVVLTTKHHEGFCLWNSKHCDFNSTKSAAKRDLLEEYVTAIRDAGLKVGLYYSLGDWHNPDWFAGWKGDTHAGRRFVQWTHALVDELMTDYGKIDILWYDLPQCYPSDQWRMVELNASVRAKQPGILINNRGMTTEDFATPEQHAHPAKPGRLWEVCMTLNKHWGYCPSDREYKSPRAVAANLAFCAANQGNLLLNVGPDPTGHIPDESQTIL
jgi:alpha-L-fucosidase